MTLDHIKEEIEKANKVVILTHESPDGDAMGSSLAMKLMLQELNKQSDVIIPEYPRMFQFLPSASDIKMDSERKKYDLAISVDCGNFKRLAKNEYFENAQRVNRKAAATVWICAGSRRYCVWYTVHSASL